MSYYSNPYYYGGYPQYYQQPMVYPQQQQLVEQQPQYSPQNVNTPPKNDDSYFIWVQGEAGAKGYPVARGTTVPLFDSEGDFVYFKSVDSNGVPLPLVTKVISDPQPDEKVEEVKVEEKTEIDMSGFVTKESYDDLKKKCDDLEFRIMELETKPTSNFTSTFTGNTFNNSRKGETKDVDKFPI